MVRLLFPTLAIALSITPVPVKAQCSDCEIRKNDSDDIIVTARRRDSPLDGAKALEDQSAARISTYGARTVDEVIERLGKQQGGRPFSIIVNGRRIGSIADIGDLPAEALESIQIYPSTMAGRFGFSPTDQLLNIQLKQRFRSLALDVDRSAPTDGGAESRMFAPRGARLDGDHRGNGTITWATHAGLRTGDGIGVDQSGREGADRRSLIPQNRSIATSLGASRPLGVGTLDMNLRGTLSRSAAWTGFDNVTQRDRLQSVGVSTTYNVQALQMFWTISTDIDISNARSLIERHGACVSVSGIPCIKQDRTAKTIAGMLSATMSGKILDLKQDAIRFASSLRREVSQSDFVDAVTGLKTSGTFGSTSVRVNISIPVQMPGLLGVGPFGRVEISPAIDYNATDQSTGGLGKSMAITWSVTPSFALNSTFSERVAPPGNIQTLVPRQTVFDVLLFDYRANALVPVNLIVGGARLAPQSFKDIVLSANYNTAIAHMSTGVRVGYNRSTSVNPFLTVREPSRLFERILPQRFMRNATGTLLQVDARPFNGRQQTTSSVSASVNLSGYSGSGAFSWDLTLTGDRQLQKSLLIADGAPLIDLLRNPLSVTAGMSGRSRWNGHASFRSQKLGANLTMEYSSAIRSASIGEPVTSLYTAPLLRIDGGVFFQSAMRRDAPKYRIDLGVKNIFNRRPITETSTVAAVTRLDPRILDPLGRVVTFTLRLPIV